MATSIQLKFIAVLFLFLGCGRKTVTQVEYRTRVDIQRDTVQMPVLVETFIPSPCDTGGILKDFKFETQAGPANCQGIQGHFGYGPSYQAFRDNKEGHAQLGMAASCGQCHYSSRSRNLPIFAEMKKSRVYLKEILSAPKVLPGVFSHKRNPIDIIANGRKIAEATGGEYIFNPKQVSTMKRLVKKNDKTGLHSYVRSLIQKFEKP